MSHQPGFHHNHHAGVHHHGGVHQHGIGGVTYHHQTQYGGTNGVGNAMASGSCGVVLICFGVFIAFVGLMLVAPGGVLNLTALIAIGVLFLFGGVAMAIAGCVLIKKAQGFAHSHPATVTATAVVPGGGAGVATVSEAAPNVNAPLNQQYPVAPVAQVYQPQAGAAEAGPVPTVPTAYPPAAAAAAPYPSDYPEKSGPYPNAPPAASAAAYPPGAQTYPTQAPYPQAAYAPTMSQQPEYPPGTIAGTAAAAAEPPSAELPSYDDMTK